MLVVSPSVVWLRPPTVICAVTAFITLASCVTVDPTRRGRFAQPEMDPAATALEEQFHSHVEAAREAGFGGHGSQGGGCGCG